MGYTTDFTGQFDLDRPLDDDTYNLLVGLSTTRRMKRSLTNYGVEGEFYVGSRENFGQNKTPDIVDFNSPPVTQPGLWCQWRPTEDRLHIEWDGNEKFYNYVEWIKYLISKVLAPRNYYLNGTVDWQGEDNGDSGQIVILNNDVSIR
jgi:hypothetical protein